MNPITLTELKALFKAEADELTIRNGADQVRLVEFGPEHSITDLTVTTKRLVNGPTI